MLSPADEAVVRRDAGLPGLGLVLDADRIGERLAALWPEAGLGPARAVYLRYKPRTSCLVAYRVSGRDGERDVHAIARAAGAGPKLQKARERASRPGGATRTAVLEDCAVVVSVFPSDAALPVLARLADPDRRRRLLRAALGRRVPGGGLERLRYKPERRFVGRVTAGDGLDIVLRAHAAGGFDASVRGALGWRARPPLAVPRLLGLVPEHRLLALEWMPGRPLSEGVRSGGAGLAELQLAGEALGQVHGSAPSALLPRRALAEARHIRAVAAMLAFVHPGQAARAEYLGREIAARVAARTGPGRPVHGDFSAEQVLVAGDTAAVLDFDEAALADPASDLGSFLAHLEGEVLWGRLHADRVGGLGEAFLRGYARMERRPSDGDLALHVAAALFHLAPRFFRDRDPSWPQRTEQALDAVESHLGRRSGAHVAVAGDPPVRDDRNPFLAAALDPALVADGLRRLPELEALLPGAVLESIRVLRHKPGRRCLVEYTLRAADPSAGPVRVLGKVRARGADLRTFRLVGRLYRRGFDTGSPDGISVPRPLGALPELGLWMQARVAGEPATHRLAGPGGAALAARVAGALHKLHGARVRPGREHGLADELLLLGERLDRAARERPAWAGRLARLADGCARAAAGVPSSEAAVIHRDFYPDQVLVDGDRLYLLDLDLCATGDPSLDAGNFAGHLVEQGLRGLADPRALAEAEGSFLESFLARSRHATRAAVAVYTTLTLARHVWISTQLPERRGVTAPLLDLCERRLDLGVTARKVTHAV